MNQTSQTNIKPQAEEKKSRKLLTAEMFFLLLTVAVVMLLVGYYIGTSRVPTKDPTITMEVTEVIDKQVTVQTTDGDEIVPININTATVLELETLPGIGDVIAQRIVDYRETHGDFTDIQELTNVQGIGDVRIAQLADYITVEDGT